MNICMCMMNKKKCFIWSYQKSSMPVVTLIIDMLWNRDYHINDKCFATKKTIETRGI